MSNSHAPAQDARSVQADRRRKRKERTTASRTPEPKDIVSGAGQPLDLSVRRELEGCLGHDFSRVRLHTDRDAGALTELLGADAVAVGQDIFFREGAYLPGTADGQRLLAHELLHTVQNPDGLGALRAGRDLGAVSLPQQAMEREAESVAREVTSPEPDALAPGSLEPAARLREEGATPGWLRYATVDADRSRTERIDPATLVDRLANGVLRSLRGDPRDLSGRVRWELARLSPQLHDSVLDRLETRLLSTEYDRLLDLADEAETVPMGFHSAQVPAPEADLFEELEVERVRWKRAAEGERAAGRKLSQDAREEADETRSRDEQFGGDRSRARADAAAEDKEAAERAEQEDKRARSREHDEQEQRQEEEQQQKDRQRGDEAADERAREGREGTEQAKEERKAQRDREEQDPEQANAPGSEKRKREDDAKRPAAGSRQEGLDPKAKEQPGRVRPEKVDERAEERDSALSEHGLHEKDEDEGEPREEEKPLGLEAGADKDVEGGEAEKREQAGSVGASGNRSRGASAAPVVDELNLPEGASPASIAETLALTVPEPDGPPSGAGAAAQGEAGEAEGPDEDAAVAASEGRGSAAEREEAPASSELPGEQPAQQEVGPDPEGSHGEEAEPETEGHAAPRDERDGGDRDGGRAGEDERGSGEEADPDGGEQRPDAKDAEDTGDAKAKAEGGQRDSRGPAAAAAAADASGRPGQPAPGTAAAEADEKAPPAPTPPAGARKPAGAHTEPVPTEDRHPSPAARRAAEPARGPNEAPVARSSVPKESGPGAAPGGAVGAPEPVGPTAAAGPGSAPSPARAAVGPAAEQADSPGKSGAPAPEGAQPRPEASLEKDGGGCAPPEPAAEKDDGGKGGCGGGGGEAAPEEKQPEPPDVSAQDPKAAIGTVSRLPPDQAAAAMPGVDQAADKKVREEQHRLDADPPKRERPSGAPRTQAAPPQAAPPAAQVTGRVERLGPEDQGGRQRAKGSEKAEGQKATDSTPPPPVPVAKELSAEEAESVEAAADAVPTVDPELRDKTVGPAPKIKLEGPSDPQRTDDQAKALKEKQSRIRNTGREDAAKPMGEDRIFPNAPREQLVGQVSGRAGGRGGVSGVKAGSKPKPGVGAVAQQERGAEIQGAAGQAQGDMTAKEKEHQQGEQRAEREKQTEIDREVAQNSEKQTAERGRAAEEAQRQRADWRAEQDKKVEDADGKSEKEHTARNKEIVKGRDDKDKEVNDRKDKDNQQIDTERVNAEKEAERKKEEKKPSGGFFGWLADKVKGFFSALLEAVTAVFDAARKAVNGIIDTFKEWADKAIDFVRDLAVKAINLLADALIAIGDVLLAAFPELRDKFRRAIEGLRDQAIAAVNKLADGLKKAVHALLDALAAGINKLLDVLEAGIKAVIKAYQAVILGAIKFAQAAIEALGKFAALIADIAPDPGGWLKKAGSAAKSGITDHLWGAIKTGVKRWFDTKVEGILGLGKAVINTLVKGCVSIKQIGKMAWDAIIASLPMMIASIVIEKLVSMIVPAAGAILTIVQGLMAAWQSISSILAAFGKFWAYLKAVKAGPAACLFAEAVAAGIVALLDFIANFLMIRLSGATKGIGKRLKSMAQKIMQGLKKTGKGARKAAGGAVNRARGAVRRAHEALRAPASPAGRTGPRAPAVRPAGADRPRTGPARRPESPPTAPDLRREHDQDREHPDVPAAAPPRGRERPGERPDTRRPDKEKPSDVKEPRREKGQEKPGKEDNAPEKKPDRADDHTPDRSKDEPSRQPAKRGAEAPRPAKPRRPASLPGRALKRVKGVVRSALRKVRNAGRTLGGKLRKSRLGRSVTRTAKKLRDAYLAKIRNLRRMHSRQQQRVKDRRDRQAEKDRTEKDDDKARETAEKPPTVKASFTMGGQQHRMVLKPAGDDVDVRMESELLPLQDQYSAAYNNIEYIKSYVNSIEDAEVRNRFREEVLDDVVDFQKDSVRKYKVAFKKAFPHREQELTRPRKRTRRQVRNQVLDLLVELRTMNSKITRWAAATGIEDFSRGKFDKALLEKGKRIWDREYKSIKGTIDGIVNKHRYKGKRLEYVGSLKSGLRGPHKGKTAFNINDFDVDLFVVHPEEWKRVYPMMKRDWPEVVDNLKMFPRPPHLQELINKGDEVGGELATALEGRLKDVSEIRNETEIVLRWQEAW